MTQRFRHGSHEGEVKIRQEGATLNLVHEGHESEFEMVSTPSGVGLLREGKVYNVTVGQESDEKLELFVNGQAIPVDWIDERRFRGPRGPQGAGSEREIRAIMPGRVIRVHVGPGDILEAGDPVLVLEAMKMENEIKALVTGTVREILAEVGKSVEAGEVLLRIDPVESATA